MPDFTYNEIGEEMKVLGFVREYPEDSAFTDAEIDEAVANLSDYYLSETVATLAGTSHAPAIVKKFAELAALLDAELSTSYSLEAKRVTNVNQRRASALSNLKSRRHAEWREQAKASLERKASANNHVIDGVR